MKNIIEHLEATRIADNYWAVRAVRTSDAAYIPLVTEYVMARTELVARWIVAQRMQEG